MKLVKTLLRTTTHVSETLATVILQTVRTLLLQQNDNADGNNKCCAAVNMATKTTTFPTYVPLKKVCATNSHPGSTSVEQHKTG